MARILPTLLVGASLAQPAAAQGVPTFDAEAFARTAALITQRDRDIALQEDRLTREQELAEIERQQLAALESILEATTTGSYAAVAGTVAALEAGTEEETGIAAVSDAHYSGSHWLASFATYLETRRGIRGE